MKKVEFIHKEGWLVNYINDMSDRYRNIITNTARMEELAFNRVSRYVDGDKEKLKHRRVLIRLVNEVRKQHETEYKTEHYMLFNELESNEDEEGQVIEFEPLDVLANVESEVIRNETIALLAEGDRIKSMVLQSWSDGNDNNASISRTLASTFGGNAESHRRAVNRFRTECRKQLTTAI